MPGETISCIGCHEQRIDTPSGLNPVMQAMRRPASKITPLKHNKYVYDFPRDVQPILDRHCVRCHSPEKPEGRILLNGDNGPVYSVSYFTLFSRRLVVDGRNGHGNSAPRTVGDSASPLMKLLDGSHYEVNVSEEERETIRNWINVGGFYPGTYAAIGVGMLLPNEYRDPGFRKALGESDAVLKKRCMGCHHNQLPAIDRGTHGWNERQYTKPWDVVYNTHTLYNMTRPEHSTILLAPLAKHAGGWGGSPDTKGIKPRGRQVTKASRCPTIFRSTRDPGYQKILNMITKAAAYFEKDKRWNMPGFKPHPIYVREMKKFGILPDDFTLRTDNVDVYEVDRRYWESQWYYPKNPPQRHKNPRTQALFIAK
jgi:hypothetical protein